MTRPRLLAMAAVVAGAAIASSAFAVAPGRLPAAYLAGVAYLLTCALGAVALGAVLRLSGARWAAPFLRANDAISGTLPLMLPLVVPLLVHPAAFYPWARGDLGGHGGLIHNPRYFGPVPFALRVLVELGALIALEELGRRRSLAVDRPNPRTARTSTRSMAAASLVATAFVGTSLINDLVMSATGEWSSDVFGLYAIVGGFAAAIAALAVVAHGLRGELGTTASHTRAIASVALVAIALWGYLAFALFLLVWIADVPREVPFFLRRAEGAWRPVFVALATGHFVVPLLLLLRRAPKRSGPYVAFVGGWITLVHAVDIAWLVMPNVARAPSPLDLGPVVALGGVGALTAMIRFRRHPSLPKEDPSLANALAYESA